MNNDHNKILSVLKPFDECLTRYNTLFGCYSEKELLDIIDKLDEDLEESLPVEIYSIAEDLGYYLEHMRSIIDYPEDYRGLQEEWTPEGVERWYCDYDKLYSEYTDKCIDLSFDLVQALSEEAEKRG